ncbi:Adenylate cyclase type 4 [Dinochytrium kinnereticum]|nr:Adenylate cyclase type 4 [Dinochytrium kinnereticum]
MATYSLAFDNDVATFALLTVGSYVSMAVVLAAALVDYISPSLGVLVVVWWRFSRFERVVRLEFISYKRLQMEMGRQIEQRRTLANLLDIMLPKSVIPRLIGSNFKFSTVSDRFDNAFCIFIDFFKSTDLKDQDFEVTATLLNETFKSFDILLREFPEVEKIKTIGSKVLLLFHPCKNDSLDKASERITMLAWEIIRKLIVLNADEIISIQSALLYQLPNDHDFPKRDIRIGISLGPIVAGIVGEEKFCYDVYGDTVNVASRLQSLGLGNVLATKEFFDTLNPAKKVLWTPLGLRPVKGRGELEVFALQHPFITRSSAKRNTLEATATPSSNAPSLQMRRRLSSTGLAKRPMSIGIGELIRRQNRQTAMSWYGSNENMSPGGGKATLTVTSPIVKEKTGNNGGAGGPRHRHSIVSISGASIGPMVTSASHVVCSPVSTSFPRSPQSSYMEETPKSHPIASAWDAMQSPQIITSHPPVQEEAEVLPNDSICNIGPMSPPTGSLLAGMNTMAMAQSASVLVSGTMSKELKDRSAHSIVSSEMDPFQPIMEKVHPLLSDGKAQELYEAVANFLIPWRLIFREHRIEAIFRKSTVQSDTLLNYQHALCGIILVWLLILTAVLSDVILYQPLITPSYVYVSCLFGLLQVGIAFAQVGDGWRKRLKGQDEKEEKSFSGKGYQKSLKKGKKSALSFIAFLLSTHIMGYVLNILPIFGACTTLCLFSNYGRLFDQARGAIMQCFITYAVFVKNKALGYMERFIILTILISALIISSGVYVSWNMYDIFTTLACHALLQVVIHRMECVMRTDFLLKETLFISKTVSDRQTKLSTGLLNAILPQRIMKKLIQNIDLADKSAIIDFFDCISVIHTDITSFTVLSSKIQPDALIKILNTVFSAFDKICRAHGVEKIITVGDAYIAAHLGYSKGEPNPLTHQIAESLGFPNLAEHMEDDPGEDVQENELGLTRVVSPRRGDPTFAASLSCRTALSMIAALQELADHGTAFAQVPGGRLLIRAGIDSGTARGFVTGGYTKIKYELFGEAVDRAEKVQEMATPGTVFVSKVTAQLLQDKAKFNIDQSVGGVLKDGTECFHVRGLSSDERNLGLLMSCRYVS